MDGITGAIGRRALAMLWSAGVATPPEERRRILTAAWSHRTGDEWTEAGLHGSACRLLQACGHSPGPSLPWEKAIREVVAPRGPAPRSGDAVRLTAPWSIVPAGGILTLSDAGRTDGFRIGRGGHYMEHDGQVHLTAGGPSTHLALDATALVPTGETVRRPFWRFADLPGPGQGVDFTRPVALWEWDGDQTRFLTEPQRIAA